MNAQSKETDARILIDDQLRAAGWNPADKSQVLTEVSVSGTNSQALFDELIQSDDLEQFRLIKMMDFEVGIFA